MNERIEVLSVENGDGYFSIHLLPSLRIIEIRGNCTLTFDEMNKVGEALVGLHVPPMVIDRYIFMFPGITSETAFELADFINARTTIRKAAFIVSPLIHDKFRKRLFWEICHYPIAEVAYIEAIRMVCCHDIDKIDKDEPVDYSSLNVESSSIEGNEVF